MVQENNQMTAFKIFTKSYILYVCRVPYQRVSEIPVMRNLMQGSVRDFSLPIVKNYGHSVEKEQYPMGKKA